MTRRERNEVVGEYAPSFSLPEHGKYIWNWFTHLNSKVSRIKDGICYLIPLQDYLAWAEITDNIVYSWEYDILMQMDEFFCLETNLELEAKRVREQELRESQGKKR